MIAHVSYFMIAHVSYFFFHSFGIWSETRNGLQWSTRWQTKLPRRPYHSNHLLSKSPVANSGSFAGNDLHNKGDEFWFHPVHKTRAILRSWVLFPTLKQATSHMSSRWHVLHATHCNTLQHTATHCNTLPHTATHHVSHVKQMTRLAILRSTLIYARLSWNLDFRNQARWGKPRHVGSCLCFLFVNDCGLVRMSIVTVVLAVSCQLRVIDTSHCPRACLCSMAGAKRTNIKVRDTT